MKYLVDQNNKIYKRALKREMEVWQKAFEETKSVVERDKQKSSSAIIGENHPTLLRYENSKFGIESESESGWVDFIVQKFKKVNSALSLGSATGKIEKAFIERGFVDKFDTIDIIQNSPNKNNMNDLNFIHLPSKKYDFILCKSVLHHIINLEHLLFEVNKALTNEGVLVVKEFCGESKSQWSNEKIKILNSRIEEKFGDKYPFLKIAKAPMWNTCPFEGIRSSEILPIIKKYFSNKTDFEVTFNGVATPFRSTMSYVGRYKSRHYNHFMYNLIFLHPVFMQERNLKNNAEQVNEIFEFAVELDRELSNHQAITPCTLFGVYRKSNIIAPIPVKPWTTKELRYYLDPHYPIYRIIKSLFKRFTEK